MSDELQQQYEQRIGKLISVLGGISHQGDRTQDPATMAKFQQCYSATLSLGSDLYGSNSLLVRELLDRVAELRAYNVHPGVMDREIALLLMGFLSTLQDEVRSGLVRRVFSRAVGEAISDFLIFAREALEAEEKEVAAVLAAAALEDGLKRKASELGVEVEERDLSEVVNALRSRSFFQGAQNKIVGSYVTFRNKAMHAEWSKIERADVASVISFLEEFLVRHF